MYKSNMEYMLNKLFIKKQHTYDNNNISMNMNMNIPVLSIDIDYYATFFVLILSLLIIVFITSLSWYIAHNKANKNRKCSRKFNTSDRKINVTAYDKKSGLSLYDVRYDLDKNTFNTECVCEEGKSANNFKFNVRNLASNTSKTISKTCKCTGKYDRSDIYYKGNPGLIDFMNNIENTYVFTNS